MNELNLEISKDPFFNNFIEKRNLSKSTKTVYMGRIRSYCDFLGKNPSELIQDAQKRKGMKVDELVNSYIEELKQTGKSPTTIVNNLDTVKAFYNEFQIDTNPIKNISIPEINKWGNNKIISRDQIKEVLELSSLRDKAIILLHLSSGMEARELRCLTYGDFINSISEYVDLNQGLLNFRKVADELFNIDNLVGTWKIKKVGREGLMLPLILMNHPLPS
jgi:Site-specific recombinase XerD